jgi:hypothetical protein
MFSVSIPYRIQKDLVSGRVHRAVTVMQCNKTCICQATNGRRQRWLFMQVISKEIIMKKTAIIVATVGALALSAIATTAPAEARRGFGPGIAGGIIAGAAIAGAASSAYAWAPGPDAYYDQGGQGYYGGPGYGGPSSYGYRYGSYSDQSEHGGQAYYGR